MKSRILGLSLLCLAGGALAAPADSAFVGDTASQGAEPPEFAAQAAPDDPRGWTVGKVAGVIALGTFLEACLLFDAALLASSPVYGGALLTGFGFLGLVNGTPMEPRQMWTHMAIYGSVPVYNLARFGFRTEPESEAGVQQAFLENVVLIHGAVLAVALTDRLFFTAPKRQARRVALALDPRPDRFAATLRYGF